MDVTPRTTHLISLHTQTAKVASVLQHRAAQVWVLHPDWLVYCRWSLSRVQESTFMLNQLQPGQSMPCPVMDCTPLDPPLSAPVALPPASASAPAGSSVPSASNGVNQPGGAAPRIAGAGGSGSGGPTVDAGSEQRKRARSGSDLEQGPFSADVLNTLKKLRAAGPAPMPSQAGVPTAAPVTLNGASLHRLPGATVPDLPRAVPPTSSSASTSDPMRRKDLFRNTAVTALGTSAISNSTGGDANGPARVGVIKKKVNALVLERDSSGAAESPVSRRQQSVPPGASKASGSVAPQAEERPVSSVENVKRDSSTAAHTNRRRPSFAPLASSELRYSPGKVRVAGPGELDTSYRLDPAEAAAVPAPYFAELAAGSAGDTAESASGFSASSCSKETGASNRRGPEMEEGEVAEEGKEGLMGRRGTARRARGDSPVSDNSKSSSRSRDSSHSSASRSSSEGANSLLGTGDGDYEDEDDATGQGGSLRGSEEEGYEVGEEEDSLCDEGLLCCNDDQGSTCSATALEEGDSWGRRSARRRRVPALSYEGYAAGGVDRSAADRPFYDPDVLLFNGSSPGPAASAGSLRELHRDNSSSGSLRSAHAASSSEDDGSDFEVMMMRRRGVSSVVPDCTLQNGVGLVGMGSAAVGGGALAWMATLSDEDELVGDS
jgi:hypothetical protein